MEVHVWLESRDSIAGITDYRFPARYTIIIPLVSPVSSWGGLPSYHACDTLTGLHHRAQKNYFLAAQQQQLDCRCMWLSPQHCTVIRLTCAFLRKTKQLSHLCASQVPSPGLVRPRSRSSGLIHALAKEHVHVRRSRNTFHSDHLLVRGPPAAWYK